MISVLSTFGPVWLIAAVWISFAGTVALVAGRRGYNQFVWFFFSLLTSPLAGLVLLLLITPRQGPHRPA